MAKASSLGMQNTKGASDLFGCSVTNNPRSRAGFTVPSRGQRAIVGVPFNCPYQPRLTSTLPRLARPLERQKETSDEEYFCR